MRTKGISVRHFLKALNLILVLVVFVPFGCKGKEVAQQAPQTPVKTQEKEQITSETEEMAVEISEEPTPDVSDRPSNTAPQISVLNVYPQNPVAGDTVKIDVKAYDKEGDLVDFTYQWFKNDEELDQTSNSLLITEDYKRDDKISVKLVPEDSERKGSPVEMFVFIANSPPVLKPSAETLSFDGSVYSYQVRATDPDGDTLTYYLKSAPPGMTINQENGQIRWDVPPDYKGRANITVAVNDGNGGEILHIFSLDIQPEII